MLFFTRLSVCVCIWCFQDWLITCEAGKKLPPPPMPQSKQQSNTVVTVQPTDTTNTLQATDTTNAIQPYTANSMPAENTLLMGTVVPVDSTSNIVSATAQVVDSLSDAIPQSHTTCTTAIVNPTNTGTTTEQAVDTSAVTVHLEGVQSETLQDTSTLQEYTATGTDSSLTVLASNGPVQSTAAEVTVQDSEHALHVSTVDKSSIVYPTSHEIISNPSTCAATTSNTVPDTLEQIPEQQSSCKLDSSHKDNTLVHQGKQASNITHPTSAGNSNKPCSDLHISNNQMSESQVHVHVTSAQLYENGVVEEPQEVMRESGVTTSISGAVEETIVLSQMVESQPLLASVQPATVHATCS